jgi:hypothetical protein
VTLPDPSAGNEPWPGRLGEPGAMRYSEGQ